MGILISYLERPTHDLTTNTDMYVPVVFDLFYTVRIHVVIFFISYRFVHNVRYTSTVIYTFTQLGTFMLVLSTQQGNVLCQVLYIHSTLYMYFYDVP
jgi:hypothetical protein